ncbi:MAG: hypothetical protein CMC98_00875 [Flavobacteriales bacterium]|nr:hypothetical protein [Flavobacteriales bacterium]
MINYLKDKFYWYSIYSNLKDSFKDKKELKILLSGYPKSGNTWLRFMIFNYLELLDNKELNETISFNFLNQIQSNVLEKGLELKYIKNDLIFYRTHSPYSRCYKLFDVLIFIHRNPLDTLISAYYYYLKRELPFYAFPKKLRNKLKNIDFFVLYNFKKWLIYYKKSVSVADVIVNYSDLKTDPSSQMKKIFIKLKLPLKDELIKKTVKLSSFRNIKVMASKLNQLNGMASKEGESNFKGIFVRSGEELQYKNELKAETVNYILNQFPEFYEIYPNLIEK